MRNGSTTIQAPGKNKAKKRR